MLPDLLKPSLLVVFVGTAKGATSARAGHYYAHPTNMFWNLLQATGLAGDDWIRSAEDATVLERGVGLTDLVPGRAASSDALLRLGDFDGEGFIAKIEVFKPRVVAFNGERAAKEVARHLGHPTPLEGPIEWTINDSLAYRLPSSSGSNTERYAAKRAKWVQFGKWVRTEIPD